MGQKTLRCPFCLDAFKTITSYRSKRLKNCPYCKKDFFYFRNVYYIRIADKEKINTDLIQPKEVIKHELVTKNIMSTIESDGPRNINIEANNI